MEISRELRNRFWEAIQDTEWAEKLRAAATWEEYTGLLGEKGIELPSELKAAFDEAHTVSAGMLKDDELEKVSGGSTRSIDCPQAYGNYCFLVCCPHVMGEPRGSQYYSHCALGYWELLS